MATPHVSFEVRINKWGQIASRFEPEVSSVIGKTLFDAYTGSQIMVPVDTTALKNSGQVSFSPGSLNGEIAYHMYYAGYVHEGTFRMAARPFLRDAVEQVVPGMEQAFGMLESRLG